MYDISGRSLRSMFAEFATLMAIAVFCFAGYVFAGIQIVANSLSKLSLCIVDVCCDISCFLINISRLPSIVSTAMVPGIRQGKSYSAIMCTSNDLP